LQREHDIGAVRGPTLWLAAAGFVATAVSFGPARMGFGLFLPGFREDFALSTTFAGFIASGGFLAFLLALPLTAWLAERIGQRVPVVVGALSATAGFAVVATATSVPALAAGVALAGASAGFCWAPFNDAVERIVPESLRPGALSAIATGTTLGVAAAGALAIGVTFDAFDWRMAWGIFALAGVVAVVAARLGLPGGRQEARGVSMPAPRLLRRAAWPLHAAALLYGATNAVYLSFAADRVVGAGGLPGLPEAAASAVIFVSYGVCGLVGAATGWMEARLGLSALLSAIFVAFAASVALIALAPGSWAGVVLSAGMHGAAVMTISAVLSFWSLRLFPGCGSLGFSAALVATASGSVLGPALAGSLVDLIGATQTFLLASLPAAAVALAFGASAVREGA